MNYKALLITILLCICNITLYSQQGDILKSEAITIEYLGDFVKAAGIYENAVKAYDEEGKLDTLTVYKAGQCYAKGKAYNLALPLLQRCKELNYQEPGVYLYLGISQEGMGMKTEAEETYKEGKTKFPDDSSDFRKKLGQLYYSQKKYNDATIEFEEALKSFPEDITILNFLGTSYDNQGKYEEAAEVFEKVLEKKPDHKNATVKLGIVYYKKASALYKKETKKYEAIKSPSRMDYHNYKDKLEGLNDYYKKALPYLEKAHEKSPSNKSINSCLSITYKRLGLKEKEAEINKLIK